MLRFLGHPLVAGCVSSQPSLTAAPTAGRDEEPQLSEPWQLPTQPRDRHPPNQGIQFVLLQPVQQLSRALPEDDAAIRTGKELRKERLQQTEKSLLEHADPQDRQRVCRLQFLSEDAQLAQPARKRATATTPG